MLNFIVAPDTNNITMFVNGKSRCVGPDHPNYKLICAALKSRDEKELSRLLDAPVILNGAATLNPDGTVTLLGRILNSTISKRVIEFSQKGLPVEPLLRFIENCARNPSSSSVDELFDFLQNKGIPITEDGEFLCYKAVRSDFMDKYKGEFYNGVGTIVRMDRKGVDPDRDRECSFGLHVGALPYVSSYGSGYSDIWLLVKVNPANCVAVPRDYNAQKMRVSEYLVVQVLDKDMSSQKDGACYSSDGANVVETPPEDWNDSWDSYECEDAHCEECGSAPDEDCGEPNCPLTCEEQKFMDEIDKEQEERMAIFTKESDKQMARHTRDSAVARCVKLGLVDSVNMGRDLGKQVCCGLLAQHKLNTVK